MLQASTCRSSGGISIVPQYPCNRLREQGHRPLRLAKKRSGYWKNLLFSKYNLRCYRELFTLYFDETSSIDQATINLTFRLLICSCNKKKFQPALLYEDLHCVKKKFFNIKQINFVIVKFVKTLDEFQGIHKFCGETAEWDLRACIQQHQNSWTCFWGYHCRRTWSPVRMLAFVHRPSAKYPPSRSRPRKGPDNPGNPRQIFIGVQRNSRQYGQQLNKGRPSHPSRRLHAYKGRNSHRIRFWQSFL